MRTGWAPATPIVCLGAEHGAADGADGFSGDPAAQVAAQRFVGLGKIVGWFLGQHAWFSCRYLHWPDASQQTKIL